MCGRARCSLRTDDFPRACHLNGRPMRHVNMDRYRPSYNVSPGFNIPVIRREERQDGDGPKVQDHGVVLECMKWGLLPNFTKKSEKPDHYRMFNARSESVKEKPSFRRLIPTNRCLVAVEGFYEWKKDGSKKQPYYIHIKDERPMVFAALFDSWKNSEGEVIYTFTILTTSASSSLEWLHDRMPVILGNKEATEMWLNGPASNVDTLLKPYEESDLAWYPVTPAMGKPSLDGPECIKEIQLESAENKSISQFFSPKGHQVSHDNKSATKSCADINQPNEVKEESDTHDSTAYLSIRNTDEYGLKPSTAAMSFEKDTGVSVKQEYEGLAGDSADSKDGTIKPLASTVTKKRGIAGYKTWMENEIEAKKLLAEKIHKPGSSPARKKATGAGDKQTTLFSYFGKG